jgi:hypothetical protein
VISVKNLLVKELRLARHPTVFIFLFLGMMLLIPNYPYFVTFIYTCLSIFFIFLQGRENKDILFTVSLPVNKGDVVKARCLFIAAIEIAEILAAVPFAILGARINPSPAGNEVGIEANVAFFGLVFMMYAIFNLVFLPIVYRTAFKLGRALILASLATTLFIIGVEAAVRFVPVLNQALDTTDATRQVAQLPVLGGGLAIFVLSMLLAYRLSARRFARVDL